MAILSYKEEHDMRSPKRGDRWGTELLRESAGEERNERLPRYAGVVLIDEERFTRLVRLRQLAQ